MARPMRAKLKVFQTRLGFYDTVVAAPSQAAALRAWGIHQNLFARKEAQIATDQVAVAAALAHPETPLRRAVGSTDAFELEPSSLPKVPDAPKQPAKTKAKAAPRQPPDRSGLDKAEAALRQIDEKRKREEAGFHREAEALDERRSAAQAAYVDNRKAAAAAVAAASEAYRKAGGRD